MDGYFKNILCEKSQDHVKIVKSLVWNKRRLFINKYPKKKKRPNKSLSVWYLLVYDFMIHFMCHFSITSSFWEVIADQLKQGVELEVHSESSLTAKSYKPY